MNLPISSIIYLLLLFLYVEYLSYSQTNLRVYIVMLKAFLYYQLYHKNTVICLVSSCM